MLRVKGVRTFLRFILLFEERHLESGESRHPPGMNPFSAWSHCVRGQQERGSLKSDHKSFRVDFYVTLIPPDKSVTYDPHYCSTVYIDISMNEKY